MPPSESDEPLEYNRQLSDTTEEMAEAILRRIFTRIAEARAKVEGPYMIVEDRSSLRLDDRYLGWWRGGGLHRVATNNALDALVTMQTILEPVLDRTAALPMVSLHPLSRAAIENAALAIYLLSPPSRDERLRRSYRAVADEADLQRVFSTGMGNGDAQEKRDAVYVEVRRLIAQRGGPLAEPRGVVFSRVSYSDVVKAADTALAADPAVNTDHQMKLISWWQLLSGLSHGKQWAMITGLERSEAEVDDENESANVRQTSSLASVALGMLRAMEALECALRFFGRRSKDWTAEPEDAFEPVAVSYSELRRQQEAGES